MQDTVLPKLKQQLADTKGIFKGKERKALTEQIQRTEKEIAEKLYKLPDVLKEDGYQMCIRDSSAIIKLKTKKRRQGAVFIRQLTATVV